MSKYVFKECVDVKLWDSFSELSPQGSVFCRTEFINSLGVNCKYYFVEKGNEVLAAIPVLMDENGNVLRSPYHFAPYLGILFKSFPHEYMHKKVTREFEVSEFIINEIINIYGKFSATLSPFFNDVRPFLWYNYHVPEKGVFKNIIRYTPILKMNFKSREEYLSEVRLLRRRELKNADQVEISDCQDVDLLDILHEKTFERQNIKREEIQSKVLRRITQNAIDKNYGRLSLCKYKGEPASAYLFLFDNKRSYYLFGANHPNFRNSGCSTKLMIDNIFYTKYIRGLSEVDFIGANSPNRGDYKISFNPDLHTYFEVHYNI